MSSQKNVKITTPQGTAIWPKLNEPDRKFQPEGVYSVRLRLPDEEAESLIARLKEVHAIEYKARCVELGKKTLKQAPMPWAQSTNWDQDSESQVPVEGSTDFKFSLKAKVTTKAGKSWDQRPVLLDARLNPIPEDADPIGGGSSIRISCEVYPWYTASLGFGISLRLRAVQVLELKTYKGDVDHGFDVQDGYEAIQKTASESDASGDF